MFTKLFYNEAATTTGWRRTANSSSSPSKKEKLFATAVRCVVSDIVSDTEKASEVAESIAKITYYSTNSSRILDETKIFLDKGLLSDDEALQILSKFRSKGFKNVIPSKSGARKIIKRLIANFSHVKKLKPSLTLSGWLKLRRTCVVRMEIDAEMIQNILEETKPHVMMTRQGFADVRVTDSLPEYKQVDFLKKLLTVSKENSITIFVKNILDGRSVFSSYKEEIESDVGYDYGYGYGYGYRDAELYKRYGLSYERLQHLFKNRSKMVNKTDLSEALLPKIPRYELTGEIPDALPQSVRNIMRTTEVNSYLKEEMDNLNVFDDANWFHDNNLFPLENVSMDNTGVCEYIEEQLNTDIKKGRARIQWSKLPKSLENQVVQSKTVALAKLPQLVMLQFVMKELGYEYNEMNLEIESDKLLQQYILLSIIISTTPNDPKVTVAETEFITCLLEMKAEFMKYALSQETPSIIMVLLGCWDRNQTAINHVIDSSELLVPVASGLLKLYESISALQLVTFMTQLVMNELFWVDGGSPDAFNAFWGIASGTHKVLHLFDLKSNLLSRTTVLSDEDKERVQRFLNIRGLHLRVVINMMYWTPQDRAYYRCVNAAADLKMAHLFPWYQFIVRPLSDEHQKLLMREIERNEEDMKEQMLMNCGYIKASSFKRISTAEAKDRNFNHYVQTGIIQKTTAVIRGECKPRTVSEQLLFHYLQSHRESKKHLV